MKNEPNTRLSDLQIDTIVETCLDALLQNGSIMGCVDDSELGEERFDTADGVCWNCGLPRLDAAAATAREILQITLRQGLKSATL